jgi:hypothetical protein
LNKRMFEIILISNPSNSLCFNQSSKYYPDKECKEISIQHSLI